MSVGLFTPSWPLFSFPSQQVNKFSQLIVFFCIFPVLVLGNWVVVSALVFDIVANTVGLRTLPVWGEIHPASLSKVLTSLQGTSWAVGQVWSQLIVLVLDLFLALSLLFCSLSLVFNFDSPLLCPLQGFALTSLASGFFLVAVPLSPSSLTFPSISVIFYLARTEATGMRTCLYDTWLLFCAHWFVMFVSLFAAVRGFPSVLLSKLHINAWHIRVLPSHLLFMYMFIYVHGGL